MKIERIEETRLAPADDAEIGRLLDASFDNSFEGRSFYQQRHHVRFVARKDDRIVGHMALSIRNVRMGEVSVAVVGLAEVATDKGYRGQGIATALLKATIDEARLSPAQFYVLFGDAPLYAANGFVSVNNPVRYISFVVNRTGAIHEEHKKGLMIMSLSDLDWDSDALVDLVGHAF